MLEQVVCLMDVGAVLLHGDCSSALQAGCIFIFVTWVWLKEKVSHYKSLTGSSCFLLFSSQNLDTRGRCLSTLRMNDTWHCLCSELMLISLKCVIGAYVLYVEFKMENLESLTEGSSGTGFQKLLSNTFWTWLIKITLQLQTSSANKAFNVFVS